MIGITNLVLIAVCFVEFDTPGWMRVVAAAMVVFGLVGMMLRMPVKDRAEP